MLKFVIGNILQSDADCLVNPVNCEGFMGKGIAYQFKLKYPENNYQYIRACTSGQLKIGKLNHFNEEGKTIINFPTKNKWREKSKIEYVNLGLIELVKLLPILNITSIAIPPLGCGNGGLNWSEIKPIILRHIDPLTSKIDFLIYEPSSYNSKGKKPPKVNTSHVILMKLKTKLHTFNKLRLQKSAFLMNLYSGTEHFKFTNDKSGPYSHMIEALTRDIKEFQDYYKLETPESLELAQNIIISKSTTRKLDNLEEPINKATYITNKVTSDKLLELVTTICFLLKKSKNLTSQQIQEELANSSEKNENQCSNNDIAVALDILLLNNLVDKNLLDLFYLVNNKKYHKDNNISSK